MSAVEHVHGPECIPPPGTILCLIPGPSVVLRSEDAGIRWCFGCREHLPHTDELMGDPFDPDDPSTRSYYDPVWVRRCSRCKRDRTAFPGTIW